MNNCSYDLHGNFLFEYPSYLFTDLSDYVIDKFKKIGSFVSLPANHIFYKAGDVPAGCYLLLSGRVKAFEYTQTGEERIYNFNESGALLMEASVLLKQPLTISFKTVAASQLVYITRDDFVSAIQGDSDIASDIIYSMSSKFMSVAEQVRESACHNAEWNVCNLLLIFAYKYGEDYDGKVMIMDKLSQQMIANMLRITRMTVVRALKSLRELSLLELINGYYCIRSIDALKKHMNYLDSIQ